MSPKHTPATWDIESIGRDPSTPGVMPKWVIWHSWTNDTSGLVGAGIVSGGRRTAAYVSANEEDATLMAAAPSLLAACEQALSEIREAAEVADVDACGCNGTPPNCACCALDAAISRARGGE